MYACITGVFVKNERNKDKQKAAAAKKTTKKKKSLTHKRKLSFVYIPIESDLNKHTKIEMKFLLTELKSGLATAAKLKRGKKTK